MEEQLGEVADRLYRLPPEDFVTAREEEVKRLRREGQRELAAQVHGLRRPNKAAWLVNLLALDAPERLDALVELGDRMREAQTNLSGPELRDLTQQRRRLVDALVAEALERAEEAGSAAPGSAEEASATLAAALADPEAAEAVRSGRLLSGLEYSGFGPAPRADLAPAPVRTRHLRPVPQPARKAPAVKAAAPTADRAAEREARKKAEAARKAYAEAQERVTATRAEQAAARHAEARAKAEVDRLVAELGAAREALTLAGRKARKVRAELSAAERELAAARRRLPPP
ncbi:MAG: hypothetical protein ACJ73S_32515 [Mycobacteriales bacterium]